MSRDVPTCITDELNTCEKQLDLLVLRMSQITESALQGAVTKLKSDIDRWKCQIKSDDWENKEFGSHYHLVDVFTELHKIGNAIIDGQHDLLRDVGYL